jgi:hypothetical protein
LGFAAWIQIERHEKLLISSAFKSLNPGGALIVYDAMLDEERRQNIFGFLMGLNMLIETPAGGEYTPSQLIGWLRGAGFSDTRVEALEGPETLVVGIKPA